MILKSYLRAGTAYDLLLALQPHLSSRSNVDPIKRIEERGSVWGRVYFLKLSPRELILCTRITRRFADSQV